MISRTKFDALDGAAMDLKVFQSPWLGRHRLHRRSNTKYRQYIQQFMRYAYVLLVTSPVVRADRGRSLTDPLLHVEKPISGGHCSLTAVMQGQTILDQIM